MCRVLFGRIKHILASGRMNYELRNLFQAHIATGLRLPLDFKESINVVTKQSGGILREVVHEHLINAVPMLLASCSSIWSRYLSF